MQTPASSPSERESQAQEIILGDYVLKTQETGGRLVWENDTQTLRVNTKLFSSPEAAQMAGLKALGLRMGLQSSLQDPSHQQIRQDISAQPELQQLLQWQGLRKLGRSSLPALDSGSQNFPNAQSDFQAALDTYALTGQLPTNASPTVTQVLADLEKQVKQSNPNGSLDHFLRYLCSGKTVWSDPKTGGRKQMWQGFIAPALQKLKAVDKQTGKTEGFQYQPPQSSGLSEDQEALPEDAILTKVGPRFLGGYYRRRRCHFDPQGKNGIAQDSLPTTQWLPALPPDEESIWETKRPHAGMFGPGQENRIPVNKNALPLLETLQPANTFVLMRDSQGGAITINANGDGFDSNGNAKMSGGTLIVQGPTKDNNGPIDVNGEFEISGGRLIAIGSSGMAETPSENSSQNSLQVNFETAQSAGTEIIIQDASGKELGKLVSEKTFGSITFSSPDLEINQTYSLWINGEKYTDLTLSKSVTIEGAEFKRGPGGGGRGMRGGDFDPSQMGDREMQIPPNMDLPDNWEDMTEDEKHEYMHANRPSRGDRGFPPQMDLPDDWETMTEDERHEFMEQNRPN